MAVPAAAAAPAQTAGARLRRIGADALYLLLGFCMAIVALTVSVTGITLSLTLGLLIVGFPVALLTFACVRWLAGLERHRAALVLGAPIAADYRPPPGDRRLAARLKAAAHDPQLPLRALIDRLLPDGDGLELISGLHERSPDAKVLVMSAIPQLVNTQEVLEAGADRMLDKIAPHDQVFATIRELGGGN